MSFGNYTNNAGYINKNVTLKHIIAMHDVICNELVGSIKTAKFGDIFDLDVNQTIQYPLANLYIDNAQYTTHELTYSFQLIVMDLVDKDQNNENDVLSDTMQSIGDYISQLKHGNSYFSNTLTYDSNTDFRVSDDISCEPFTERFDALVAGWTATFDITVSFNASACDGDIM